MNWIVASTLMFVASVILYLLVRKAAISQIPQQLTNLSMFLVPAMIFFLIVVSEKQSAHISLLSLIIIVVSAYFFSYLGNVFSLKSIKYSPNPGYSLMISKSYVIFTTIVSIFLFGSSVSVKSVLSILLIIVFSALIMIDKNIKKNSESRNAWLPLALGAFFCWGMLAVASKYLMILGVDVTVRLLYLTVFVTVIILTDIMRGKTKVKNIGKNNLLILLLIGILSAGFNYFMQIGFNTAPNIGYVNAVNASSIAFVTLFSALFFKDELTARKLIGIFGATLGLILLLL